MALPNPASQMNQQQQMQYMAFSMREAVSTAMKASILQMQSNLVTKSPILSMIPGAGILRERAEVKKRELYERTGRDEQGRKLTKQELEDREKRRGDLGALSGILELLQNWNETTGVPIELAKDSNALIYLEGLHANVKMMLDFMTTGARPGQANTSASLDDLAAEERADEREREDDQDQIESEQRQQNFFSRLFGRKEGGQEGGGLFKGLLSLLGSLGSMLGGGITSLLSGLMAPIFTALTGAMASITAFVAPLLAAIGPILVAALPAILALMLGGAVGLLIANWIQGKIDDQSDKMMAQSKKEMEMGSVNKTATTAEGEKIYEISKDGKTEFKTAKELGLSREQEKTLATGDFIETDKGSIRESTYRVETSKGVETGRLAEGLGSNEILSAEIAAGKMSRQEASSIDEGQRQLMEVERSMQEYSSTFANRLESAVDDSAVALKLASDHKGILTNIKRLSDRYPDVFTKQKLVDLSKKYKIFGPALWNGKVDLKRAAYIDKDAAFIGGMGGLGDIWDADDLVIPGLGEFSIGSPLGDYDKKNLGVGSVSGPNRETPLEMSPRSSTGSDIPAAAAENQALKSAPQQQTSVNTQTNAVQQNSNTVVATGLSARQSTGVDMSSHFNGFRLASP